MAILAPALDPLSVGGLRFLTDPWFFDPAFGALAPRASAGGTARKRGGARKIGATTIVTAMPAQHDIYEIGFVVGAAGRSVYVTGDTRLHPDLPAIAERLTPDIAILSVDGTRNCAKVCPSR